MIYEDEHGLTDAGYLMEVLGLHNEPEEAAEDAES